MTQSPRVVPQPVQPDAEPSGGSSALAVIALVLAIIPPTALVGLILAIVALATGGSGSPRRGRKLAIAAIPVAIVSMVLAVIGTAVLLMTGIVQSRGQVANVLTRGQIKAIANACEAYNIDFQAYPGVVTDPPDHFGMPNKVSGSQNLRLSLLGCSRSGNALTREYAGPAASDMDAYANPGTRKYDPHYTVAGKELVPHSQAAVDADPSYDGLTEVFVDYRYSKPRPILYYRAQPRYEGTSLFEFDDNAVYCDPGRGETSTAFAAFLRARSISADVRFLLISAGPDRIYFTEDDITNLDP